jgi:predicted nuclease with TOPRIM domain
MVSKGKVNTDEIPISDITKKGMSWNIDDRKFFKVGMDYTLEKLKEHTTRVTTRQFNRIAKELGESLLCRDKLMFDKMDEQTALMKTSQEDITKLKTDVQGIKEEITEIKGKVGEVDEVTSKLKGQLDKLKNSVDSLQKKNRFSVIFVRVLITTLVSIGGSILFFLWYHAKFYQ